MKRVLLILLIPLIGCSSYQKADSVDFEGRYYEAATSGRYNNLAIMFLGGSEGGFPKLFNINEYTDLGIPSISISYFGSGNRQDHLDKIDLEYFKNAILFFKNMPQVKGKKIVVFGYSKGAELTLLLASLYADIEGVFVLNPSNVIFQSPGSLKMGISSSSWRLNGLELPYIPLDKEMSMNIRGKGYREVYEKALNLSYNDQSAIRVENINGPILIISGEEDIVWPSTVMSNNIISRLEEYDYPFWSEHIAYKSAGHTLNPLYGLGGSFIGNYKANKDMKRQVLKFLDIVSGS